MNWYDFYAERINSTYQDYFEKQYEPFLDIINQLKTDEGILELGCGIGSVSKAIGGKFKGIDSDPMMVMLANQNTNSTNFYQECIFQIDIPQTVLKVTHGVLEHFTDSQILDIVERCSNSVHYVPLDKWETPSFGDERLLPYQYWIDLVTPKAWMLFNDNKDLLFIV